MIYVRDDNRWGIDEITLKLNHLSNKTKVTYLYRDELGRIRSSKLKRNLFVRTLLRTGTKCQHCGKEALFWGLNSCNHLQLRTIDGFLNVEHIVPKALGGKDVEYNTTIFCDVCNSLKGHRLTVPHYERYNVSNDKVRYDVAKYLIDRFGKDYVINFMKFPTKCIVKFSRLETVLLRLSLSHGIYLDANDLENYRQVQ